MNVPVAIVAKDRRGRWGVKVKWPRSGSWTRTMPFWPRFVWHGPFGDTSWRGENWADAKWFAETFNRPFEGSRP